MIVVHAFVYARPEHREPFTAALRELQSATIEHDSGCLRYAFWADIDDPDRFVCVEQWTDLASLRAHLAAPHHATASDTLDRDRARPADVHVFEADPIVP